MNVSCPECRSVFRIDPAKVPASGVRARCSVCGAVVSVAAGPHTATSAPVLASVTSAPSAELLPPTALQPPAVDVGAPDERTSMRAEAASVAAGAVSRVLAPAPATQDVVAEPAAARPRPTNPFLNNTPELRARRLARALVSDLVAYNPQKREQGLRDGTLRQLFRDEIRKSWEEYVEQVGANVAESTPHFQDALNDVLAGGRRVF